MRKKLREGIVMLFMGSVWVYYWNDQFQLPVIFPFFIIFFPFRID